MLHIVFIVSQVILQLTLLKAIRMYEPNLMEVNRSIDLKVGPGKPDVQEQGLE